MDEGLTTVAAHCPDILRINGGLCALAELMGTRLLKLDLSKYCGLGFQPLPARGQAPIDVPTHIASPIDRVVITVRRQGSQITLSICRMAVCKYCRIICGRNRDGPFSGADSDAGASWPASWTLTDKGGNTLALLLFGRVFWQDELNALHSAQPCPAPLPPVAVELALANGLRRPAHHEAATRSGC